jgi:tetraacyldisaccharide 4'-kinase
VIVVGNVRVGGTGKTPVVLWLARALQASGRRPAIVSRGYGGLRQSEPLQVRADTDPRVAGDEAVLLAGRSGAPVVVCVDRVAAARHAVRLGADVVIADDGLQHYRLARDLEIAVVDGRRRFGNGRLLPAGPLREPPVRLRDVALVLCQGEPWAPNMLSFTLRPAAIVPLSPAVAAGTHGPERGPVAAVAGIGDPERFMQLLRTLGFDPKPVPVPDHGRLDLARLRQETTRPIVMTEKDAVKYRESPVADSWYLPVEVEVSTSVRERILSIVDERLQALPAGPRR